MEKKRNGESVKFWAELKKRGRKVISGDGENENPESRVKWTIERGFEVEVDPEHSRRLVHHSHLLFQADDLLKAPDSKLQVLSESCSKSFLDCEKVDSTLGGTVDVDDLDKGKMGSLDLVTDSSWLRCDFQKGNLPFDTDPFES